VLAASAEVAIGNYSRAMENLFAVREEMARHTVIHDWYCGLLLQSCFTELWLAQGDMSKARTESDRFLRATQATAERTWQARAWEVNARVAMAESDLQRAEDCITEALSTMEGFEVPLAAWRVHATAARLFESATNTLLSQKHREASCATILKLADSLSAEGSPRQTFLSAPDISKVLGAPIRARRRTAGNLTAEAGS
jgi:hypothetical protein